MIFPSLLFSLLILLLLFFFAISIKNEYSWIHQYFMTFRFWGVILLINLFLAMYYGLWDLSSLTSGSAEYDFYWYILYDTLNNLFCFEIIKVFSSMLFSSFMVSFLCQNLWSIWSWFWCKEWNRDVTQFLSRTLPTCHSTVYWIVCLFCSNLKCQLCHTLNYLIPMCI